MKTLSVGELKTNFSAALEEVAAGETIVVSYGRSHRKVAALVPITMLSKGQPRVLGPLSDKASVSFADNFALSDNDLFGA